MKQINYLHYALICMLLMCITSCEKDETTIEDNIPIAIKNDFSTRYPSAQITTFQNYPDNLHLIGFIDEKENEASTWYADNTWKMTYTEINDMDQLPLEVKKTFKKLRYNVQDIDIYKTERDGIEKGLYALHFKHQRKKIDNVEHYVFINDDGFYLTTYNYPPNDTRWYPNLSQAHYDFIAEKYSGAEIKAYINDGGYNKYYILHNNILKCVSLRGEVATDYGFWHETRYELSIDTKIPDNVLQVLKHDDPDFVYTNIYYIESNEGNSYLLQDKNRDDELGYIIHEDLQPQEK